MKTSLLFMGLGLLLTTNSQAIKCTVQMSELDVPLPRFVSTVAVSCPRLSGVVSEGLAPTSVKLRLRPSGRVSQMSLTCYGGRPCRLDQIASHRFDPETQARLRALDPSYENISIDELDVSPTTEIFHPATMASLGRLDGAAVVDEGTFMGRYEARPYDCEVVSAQETRNLGTFEILRVPTARVNTDCAARPLCVGLVSCLQPGQSDRKVEYAQCEGEGNQCPSPTECMNIMKSMNRFRPMQSNVRVEE